jgi:D-alanyl-D-alanine carboxypeptidase
MGPMRPSARLAPLVLVATLVAGCFSVPSVSPRPTPTPTTATPSPTPTLPALATPTASPPTPTPTPTPTATTTPATDMATALGTRFQAAVDAQRAARNVPGLAATVILPDGSRWSGAAGIAADDPRRAATPDTPFVVGSISKTFVTAVVMQLVEEGVLDLDGPLSDWLPDYPRAKKITLRMLLTHSSGVANYFEHSRYNKLVYRDPDHVWTADEILSTFAAPPYFAPGDGYHYSNTGFVLLGRVIEEATGQDLGRVYRQRLFRPLGLEDTYFQGDGPPPDDSAEGFRTGPDGLYQYSDGSGYRPTASLATVAWAAGGIVSSANDIATWTHALYGGEVVADALLAQMERWTPSAVPRGDYGLGTRTIVLGDQRGFGHTGSISGFIGATWYFPEIDLTVTVLNNRGLINPNGEARALFQIAAPLAEAYRR